MANKKTAKPNLRPTKKSATANVAKKPLASVKNALSQAWLWFKRRHLWQKIILVIIAIFLLFLASIYAFSVGYNIKHRDEKVTYGVSFIPSYSRYFGLDPHETFLALRDELGFHRFRLVSYWEEIEKTPGQYDFSELDWEFDQVDKVNGQVTLSIGLRQPRWPECHVPEWLKGKPIDQQYPELEKFMSTVIDRYKNRPSLQSYQLENEYFLEVFGECKDFSRARLQKEFDFVKSKDSKTPVIMSLANNYFGVPTGSPRPDEFGVSVYKRVFDYTVTHRYFDYPFPAWYYTGRAGLTELLTGKQSMLHELQAEPWPPTPLLETSIAEQDKSMDAKRLRERLSYGKATGFKQIDLWGGEWWYWRLKKFNDPSLWNAVKNSIPENEH